MVPSKFAAAFAAALLAGCGVIGPSVNSARTDDNFNRIHPGMSGDEVRSLVGAPDGTMPFPLSHTVAWEYRYWDTFGYFIEFSVTFGNDGHVVSKTIRRLNDGGDHSS